MLSVILSGKMYDPWPWAECGELALRTHVCVCIYIYISRITQPYMCHCHGLATANTNCKYIAANVQLNITSQINYYRTFSEQTVCGSSDPTYDGDILPNYLTLPPLSIPLEFTVMTLVMSQVEHTASNFKQPMTTEPKCSFCRWNDARFFMAMQ